MFKKTILAFIITSTTTFAIADTAVNDYDCTVDELKSYIEKKSESLVQRKTAIAPWEAMKRAETAPTAASTAGAVTPNNNNGTGVGAGTPTATKDCNYFWGDLEEITYDKGSLDGILGDILSGNMSGIVDKAAERIGEITEGMISEIKKGLCKRLSTDNVKETLYDYGDNQFGKVTNGMEIGEVLDPDLNGFINDALRGSYGNTGKLINVFDPNVDAKRGNVILKEADRQMESILRME